MKTLAEIEIKLTELKEEEAQQELDNHIINSTLEEDDEIPVAEANAVTHLEGWLQKKIESYTQLLTYIKG